MVEDGMEETMGGDIIILPGLVLKVKHLSSVGKRLAFSMI